jgi:hypothetical protein
LALERQAAITEQRIRDQVAGLANVESEYCRTPCKAASDVVGHLPGSGARYQYAGCVPWNRVAKEIQLRVEAAVWE